MSREGPGCRCEWLSWSMLRPQAAGVDAGGAEAGRVVVLEQAVVVPAALRRRVIGGVPGTRGLFGIEEKRQRAVDREVSGAPILVEAREVFHASAVAALGRGHVARHHHGIDRRARR